MYDLGLEIYTYQIYIYRYICSTWYSLIFGFDCQAKKLPRGTSKVVIKTFKPTSQNTPIPHRKKKAVPNQFLSRPHPRKLWLQIDHKWCILDQRHCLSIIKTIIKTIIMLKLFISRTKLLTFIYSLIILNK